MNNTKRIHGLLLAMLLCVAMLLGACSEQASGESSDLGANEANYQVTVADVLGNPYTEGVIVRFMRNGEQAAMQVVDANGVASKVMEKGDYTVELMFTSDEGSYYYDQTDLTLSASKTELTIELAYTPAPEAVSLFAQEQDQTAYRVSTGCTHVSLTAGKRNYFLFTPDEAGTYEISAVGEVESIGYYGSPFFVQEQSAAEVVDNAFSVSVNAGMIGTDNTGTTVLVIGIDAGEAESCVLAIERTGDPAWSVADEPWTVYQTTAELAPYTQPAGANVLEFDLTASTDTYNLVYSETDGFYHLDSEDGPLVLVRLGKDVKYLDCFKTILEHSGVSKYFYDEDGNFLRKESYNECLMEYFEYMDEDNGVYPLTEDLKYIIQMRGEQSGWWDKDGYNYLFVDDNGNQVPGINPEIAWLFMCCYISN